MSVVFDKIIMALMCILMTGIKQVDYLIVCLFLVVLSMECALIYFESRKSVTIVTAIYAMLILWEPQIAIFIPLILYENARVKQFITLPIYMIIGVIIYASETDYSLISYNTLLYVIITMLGIAMGIRSYREIELKRKLHDIQDTDSLLKQRASQSKELWLKQQDMDIHAATLKERNRIAREIHDHVGHMLSRSILQLGAILAINKDEKLDIPLRGLKDSLDTAMNNIRESVHDLKDDSVDLEYLIMNMTSQYDGLEISVDYDISPYAPKELKYCIVAIVKEALTNTVKHSGSTKVNMVLREHPALYQVLIEDNGSSAKTSKNDNGIKLSQGIGLENMRERIAAFGGNISFRCENGFKIFISIPKKN